MTREEAITRLVEQHKVPPGIAKDICADLPPIPMLLFCPKCGERHIDEGVFASKVHHSHACQHCGMVWRPAVVATIGVQFLPGFKNDATA
jgi:hypothetical protein